MPEGGAGTRSVASRPRVGWEAFQRRLGVGLVLLFGTLGSVMLADALEKSEERAVSRTVDQKVDEAVVRLGHEFQTRLLALDRMADRWDVADGTPKGVWERDAANYIAHFGGFHTIARVDADGVVLWTVPAEQQIVGVALRKDPARARAMDEAWRQGGAAVSRPLELLTGGKGVDVYLPLYTGERFDGWLVGAFQIEELLRATMGPLSSFRLTLGFGDEELYRDPRPSTTVCHTGALGVFYLGWRVRVCAGEELVESTHGPLPLLALCVGLAFTLLSGGLLVALQLAGERERRARELAASLREQADALERAQRELAELSWSVSHELRTPLRAIDGYAAVLSEELPPEVHPALGRIRANAQRMAEQLDGLLELLRVARAELKLGPVDVSALARETLARLCATEPDRDVVCTVDDAIVVRGDERLLGVVLDSLIENAWKFTESRHPAHIEVRAARGGFRVVDDGVGFDMAFAHKLFASFESLHAPGEFEGLGLGLAIAARAVRRHGGRIHAQGTPGKGACFTVELPGAPEDQS